MKEGDNATKERKGATNQGRCKETRQKDNETHHVTDS